MVAATSSRNSHAALCTLHVASSKTFEQDWLLHMICQYIQLNTMNQLKILISDKIVTNKNGSKNDPALYMTIGGGYNNINTEPNTAMMITERNTILRQLLGILLHGAMDITGSPSSANNNNNSTNTPTKIKTTTTTTKLPIYWNGGFCMTDSSYHTSSIPAMQQTTLIMHYMTITTKLYKDYASKTLTTTIMDELIKEMNITLQSSSYLLPYACTPSIIDFDVLIAVLLSLTTEQVELIISSSSYKPLQRYLLHMIYTIQQLSQITDVPCPYETLNKSMEFIVSGIATSKKLVPTTFYTGTEGDVKELISHFTSPTLDKPGTKTVNQVAPNKSIDNICNTTTVVPSSTPIEVDVDGAVTASKKKLTKQDKKAAAKAAKDAESGGSKEPEQTPKESKTTTPAVTETTTFDIMALDLRIGQIVKIWEHESADKLYCEEIDFGEGEGIRQIASGLRPFYKDAQKDLLNQYVCVVYNLKKRTLVGFPSHGMVLCASNSDHTSVEIITPPPGAKLGERITFDGLDPNTMAENETKVGKKKIFESLAPDLHTNDTGVVMWKDHIAQCSTGPITAINKMANGKVS